MTRLALPLLALAACFDDRPRGGCTQVGCSSEATITLVPFTDATVYLGATVTLCVNDRCDAVVLSATPPADGGGTMEMSSSELSMSVVFERYGGRYQMRIAIYDEGDYLEHGDEYSLEIRSKAGDVVVQHTWTADYFEYEPNGEQCGPRCLQETIEIPAR